MKRYISTILTIIFASSMLLANTEMYEYQISENSKVIGGAYVSQDFHTFQHSYNSHHDAAVHIGAGGDDRRFWFGLRGDALNQERKNRNTMRTVWVTKDKSKDSFQKFKAFRLSQHDSLNEPHTDDMLIFYMLCPVHAAKARFQIDEFTNKALTVATKRPDVEIAKSPFQTQDVEKPAEQWFRYSQDHRETGDLWRYEVLPGDGMPKSIKVMYAFG